MHSTPVAMAVQECFDRPPGSPIPGLEYLFAINGMASSHQSGPQKSGQTHSIPPAPTALGKQASGGEPNAKHTGVRGTDSRKPRVPVAPRKTRPEAPKSAGRGLVASEAVPARCHDAASDHAINENQPMTVPFVVAENI